MSPFFANVNIGTKAEFRLFVGLIIIAVTTVSLPFNLASARPDLSTLHDYSINAIVTDLTPPAPIFKIKIFSNADKLMPGPNPLEKKMHFDVEGPSKKGQPNNQIIPDGYFEITIPHAYLGGNYTVLVNNATITAYNMTYNRGSADDPQGDSTTISLNYDGTTTKSIDIMGTTAIPEFSSVNGTATGVAAILAMFASAVIIVTRKSHLARLWR